MAAPGLAIDQDGTMGSEGKSRKPKRRLPKVPKYETPNTAVGFDGKGGFGRSGHSSDHHQADKPGRMGAWFLKVLGQGSKD
jgi:hypothetical protein